MSSACSRWIAILRSCQTASSVILHLWQAANSVSCDGLANHKRNTWAWQTTWIMTSNCDRLGVARATAKMPGWLWQPQPCKTKVHRNDARCKLGPIEIESKLNNQPGLAVNAKKLGYRVWCDKPFQQIRICWKNYPTMCNATCCWLQVLFLFLLWWLHSPSLMVEISTSEDKTTTKIYNHLVVDSINPFVEFGQTQQSAHFCLSDIESKVAWVNTTWKDVRLLL